jgi:hypothetical protein
MPRFRRPSEYAHDARTLKQIGNSLGIDLKEVFAAADKVKQLAPPATSNADSRQPARRPGIQHTGACGRT